MNTSPSALGERATARRQAKELIKALERRGWQLDRIRGSHHIMVDVDQRRALTVPVDNRELKAGTLAAILRTTGITREELRQLLD